MPYDNKISCFDGIPNLAICVTVLNNRHLYQGDKYKGPVMGVTECARCDPEVLLHVSRSSLTGYVYIKIK